VIAALLGRFLRGVRAGEAKLLWKHPDIRNVPDTLMLSSSAFQNGGVMAVLYAARRIGGEDQSPPLMWSSVPPNTVELVVVMEDPDAPLPVPSVHLLAAGISPQDSAMAPGTLSDPLSPEICFGKWWTGKAIYRGPMPPPSHGPHRYVFQLFALGQALGMQPGFDKQTLLRAMTGKILARGLLTGTFERK